MKQIIISSKAITKKNQRKVMLLKSLKQNWELYLLILPVIIYYILFHYAPMYGVQIAFKNFVGTKGIWGSPWIGFDHFTRFFKSYNFLNIIKNTVGISLYQLVAGFPIPIILAILMNEVKSKIFKKAVQTITYAPHFISTVVVVGMIVAFLSPTTGIINNLIKAFGLEPVYFMGKPAWFKTIYVFSGIWQNTGWNSIIYMAALSGIDPQLHESAIVDGASKMRRIWYINIPGIAPTIIILLIMNTGRIMNVGFEKVFLMQNSLNASASEIISTYVYDTGLLGAQFSYSSAIGLFNSVINFFLLITVNKIARKVSETSLW